MPIAAIHLVRLAVLDAGATSERFEQCRDIVTTEELTRLAVAGGAAPYELHKECGISAGNRCGQGMAVILSASRL